MNNAKANESRVKLCGVLLGKKMSERHFEVEALIELPQLELDTTTTSPLFPKRFYDRNKGFHDKVPSFKHDFLGWYCNWDMQTETKQESPVDDGGDDNNNNNVPTAAHAAFHSKVVAATETDSCLFLYFDSNRLINNNNDNRDEEEEEEEDKHIPIAVFEAIETSTNQYKFNTLRWEIQR